MVPGIWFPGSFGALLSLSWFRAVGCASLGIAPWLDLDLANFFVPELKYMPFVEDSENPWKGVLYVSSIPGFLGRNSVFFFVKAPSFEAREARRY